MNRPDYAGWPAGMLRDLFDGMVAEIAARPVPAPQTPSPPEPMEGAMRPDFKQTKGEQE